MLGEVLARLTPDWVRRRIGEDWKRRLRRAYEPVHLPAYAVCQEAMTHYQTKDLVNVDPGSFRTRLEGFMSLREHEMEGFADPSRQRDMTVRFHWGHDHDFGEFQLHGNMGTRHIWVLARFMDQLKALPYDLSGTRVLDIGCWTGGTSLILCRLGAEVVAIEEVKKYVDAFEYLKEAFGIRKLDVLNRSLYQMTDKRFQDAFDYVLYAGVLYHVTDPVLSLRVMFNSLRPGGKALVESAGIPGRGLNIQYQGPDIYGGGSTKKLNRSGWNWFLPSRDTLAKMMQDVGFEDVRITALVANRRLLAVGTKTEQVEMLRAGLSAPNVR